MSVIVYYLINTLNRTLEQHAVFNLSKRKTNDNRTIIIMTYNLTFKSCKLVN